MITWRTQTIVIGVSMVVATHHAWGQKSPMAQAAYARAQDHLVATRFADAATEMERAVRYEPRFALGWYVLASTSRRAGQCDRAIAAYRRYMELRPTEADPYFGVALCLRTVGERDGAIAAFQHYIDTDNRPASRAFVDSARKHLGDLKQARDAAAATAQAHPPSAVLTEARRLRELGRADDAIAKYRADIAANPKSADARVEVGTLLVSLHRLKEAVDDLRTAVRMAPDAATAWYNLAFALRETNQAGDAVEAYRRYITFKPKDADPHYGLGRALVTLGRNDEALSAFRAYVALETRPTEKRWVRKARAEIARIETPGEAQQGGPQATKPGALSPPAHGAVAPAHGAVAPTTKVPRAAVPFPPAAAATTTATAPPKVESAPATQPPAAREP